MMKYLILLAVIVGAWWWVSGRRRPPPPADKPSKATQGQPPTQAQAQAQAMLACVHCGVHLPAADAIIDASGRPFCSEAHRLAGPR